MDDTLILSLAVGGASALAYGAAYYRHRQCMAALGNQSEQLALAPRNAEKWERLVPYLTLVIIGVAAVKAYFRG